jgi:hypothetical protein
MKYFLIRLILSSSFVLTGCLPQPVKNPDSSLYSVPVGSILSLNKDISIPANLARRFFQDGKSMKKTDIDIYYPHCSLSMNTLVDYERTIKPTVFVIYKVVDDEEYAKRQVYVASNSLRAIDGPTIIGHATYYYLRSNEVSDVRALECVQWDDPYNVEYLSINQVKKSLGDYFTLEVND